VWLEKNKDTSSWNEELRRLKGQRLPRPKPSAYDTRLKMVPATQISPESWLAITGKPHPEPGEGVLFAGAQRANSNSSSGDSENNSSDLRDQYSQQNNKDKDSKNRKSVWSFSAKTTLGGLHRRTGGSTFYQNNFDTLFSPYVQLDICGERWSFSKWRLCGEYFKTLFEPNSASDSLISIGLDWNKRYEVLSDFGFGLGFGYYSKKYSPPQDDPLNTESASSGLFAQLNTHTPKNASWVFPAINFRYYYSLSGQDASGFRGTAISQQGFRIEALNKLISSGVWSPSSYDMGFSLYSKLGLESFSETASGEPQNNTLPSGSMFSFKSFYIGIVVAVEEMSW